MREITLASCGAKKLIKAANSKAKMKINNVQYRFIISKLMTFLFLRRSLEQFVEESKTNCYHFHRIKRRKRQEIEERQVQREHSAINVKYPLWNIPWHLPLRTSIRPVFTEVSSLPLGQFSASTIDPFLASQQYFTRTWLSTARARCLRSF